MTVCGAGKDNELARLLVVPGVTAREVLGLTARLAGQPVEEVVLMNLDKPVYLVGDMRLQVSIHVGVRVQ
eukprot:11212723-Lingulodinium_polyedra.AAC.1